MLHSRQLTLQMLNVLVTIMEEGNVTNAADKLSLSQSALSIKLNKLRSYFQDDLFIRSQNRMLPTSYSKDLYIKAKNIIDNVNGLSKKRLFNPALSNRNFTLAMPDYRSAVLLPRIMKNLKRISSNIQFTVKHITNFSDPKIFIENQIDLAINELHCTPELLCSERLLDDWPVLIGNAKNRLFQQPIDKKNLLSLNSISYLKPMLNETSVTMNYVKKKVI